MTMYLYTMTTGLCVTTPLEPYRVRMNEVVVYKNCANMQACLPLRAGALGATTVQATRKQPEHLAY